VTGRRLRRPAIRTLVVLAIVAAVLTGSATAWAVFSASGFSATATYTASVLPTPTISAASLGGTVTLTLGASGGTVTPLSYTLTASPAGGTGTGGTCLSSYTPASSLPASCTYTGVVSGSFTYTLTAVYNTWTRATTSNSVTVTAQFVGIGTPVTFTSTGNNRVLNYPSGTISGDLVMVVLVNGTNADATAPTGWTQIANPSSNSTGSSCSQGHFELQAFWHVSAGETSVTMSRIQANGAGVTAWVVAYRGIPSPAVNGTIQFGTNAAAINPTLPKYSPPSANTTLFSMVAVCAANTLSMMTANNFHQDVSTTSTPGTQGGGLGIASQRVGPSTPPASPVAVPVWQQSTAVFWAYITVAFT
jgi:hypothetical protein